MEDSCIIQSPLESENLTFFLIKNDNCVCEFMRKNKYWESDLCKLMYKMVNNILQDRDILLDIGSFIGTHSIPISKKFKNNEIISIEANKVYSDIQVKNLEINTCKNVRHINSIVTNDKFLDKLTVPNLDYTKVNNYGGIGVQKDDSSSKYNTITVDSLNLEKVKLIKLDVEGHELQVLEGGFLTIKNSLPLIFIEIWYQNLEQYVKSDIFNKLFQIEYKLYKIKFSIMDYVLVHSSYSTILPDSLEVVKI